ncbi:MAG: hypothetical protein Q7S37_00255 [bacterium]|nr:hypothetical protein [bacterium]
MTFDEKYAIQSMAMDLKRISLGLQRNSVIMAERFLTEAQKREKEISYSSCPEYITNILKKIKIINLKNNSKIAEDAQMYSTLLQNFSSR